VTDQSVAVVRAQNATVFETIHLVPALIASMGEQASWRYVDFFTANIRNLNTRRAYARAASRFFAWCDDRNLTLATIQPRPCVAQSTL
jgi:2-phosphoglycerate kinase